MSKILRQPFIPSGEFVVRKLIIWNGTEYPVGDDFPWEEVGCTERRLRQLYDSGHLMNKPRVKKEVPVSDEDGEDSDDVNTEGKSEARKRRAAERKRRR